MTPAAIYARYSTEEQDPRSIEDQVRRCTEHATKCNLTVVAEFADEAISGAHTDRANLRRLLDAVASTRRPPFRAVLVDDLSRLSRSIGDTWRLIDDLAAAGVKVIDVRTGMSSDDPNARVMFAASSMVNDQFLQLVRYQTHRGLQGRALGGFSTGGSLYGFTTHPEAAPSNVEHPRKLWQINEVEAAIVRRIFARVDEGKSYRAIADQLNREGVPPPRNNGRGGKHGGGWSHVTVRAILTNEKYVGRWTWNTTKWTRVPGKRTRRRLRRPESEHVTREAPELAIVDRATWDRVQDRMARRTHGDERPPRQGQRTYLTSGLLRCGVCGGPLSVRSAKVKGGVRYVNFGCTAYSSRGGSICANAATISEKKITEALIDALRDVLSGPEVQEAFACAFARRVGERTKADRPADLERQLAAAQRRVANATRLLVDDPDDLDLRRQREVDRGEVRRLEAELAQHGTARPHALPDQRDIQASISRFLDALSDASERGREALVRCMSPLTLTPKSNGPGRFEASGTIDLAQVAASGSSGGRICQYIYAILHNYIAGTPDVNSILGIACPTAASQGRAARSHARAPAASPLAAPAASSSARRAFAASRPVGLRRRGVQFGRRGRSDRGPVRPGANACPAIAVPSSTRRGFAASSPAGGSRRPRRPVRPTRSRRPRSSSAWREPVPGDRGVQLGPAHVSGG